MKSWSDYNCWRGAMSLERGLRESWNIHIRWSWLLPNKSTRMPKKAMT